MRASGVKASQRTITRAIKRLVAGWSRKPCRVGNCRRLGAEVVSAATMSLVSTILGRTRRGAGCHKHGRQHRGRGCERLRARMYHASTCARFIPASTGPDFTTSATPTRALQGRRSRNQDRQICAASLSQEETGRLLNGREKRSSESDFDSGGQRAVALPGSIPLQIRQSSIRASVEACREGGTMSQILALASIGLLAVTALDMIAMAFLVSG